MFGHWRRRDFLMSLTAVALGVAGANRQCHAEATADDFSLPSFGRDTVLVWKIEGPEYERSFIARLAAFAPDRFLEWEDEKGQGTVFMPEHDLLGAKGYESSALFASGRDKTSRNATALWLSRGVFSELKEKKSAKLNLDGVAAKLRLLGVERIPVEVNRIVVELPAVKVIDDRKAEWWFLDAPDNPLTVRYEVRNYRRALSSITTNQPDTLRWIKGSKLKEHR
ncbi:MAG: hypothetical protein LBP68_01425 [Acidobacteriota bacterium]|jgi:hypothetical protein|nr:hypothetical protein [Acidobacteriota bacterium]